MGKLLVERYKEEVEMLKTQKFKDFYVKMLEECMDTNAENAPASSSGKYHPICSLGPNGLYRHTKLVAVLAERMIQCIPDFDPDEEHDIIVVSALLHDMCKYNIEWHTQQDHPVAMASKVRDWYTKNVEGEEEQLKFERVAKCIETHMSRWNEIKDYATKKVLSTMPTPESLEQYIICFADMVAAMPKLPELLHEMKDEAVDEICRSSNKGKK